jgi:hypothetical protein
VSAPADQKRTAWQRWGWLLRIAGTAGGIAYIAHVIDFAAAKAAFGRIPPSAIAIAVALVAANVVAGAIRWRVLLGAYGAIRRPSLATCVKLYFIAFFYNNYLPGAVGGDVLRGVVTRDSFGDAGATGALAVVLVERALGLFGVFLLLALGLGVAPTELASTSSLWWWSAIGIGGSFAVVLALPFARTLARFLPGPLRTIASRVPALTSPGAFAVATILSIATQAFVTLAGFVLLNALAPAVGLGGSLLIVPLAAATTFLPITVGGAGAREAVYITLGASLFHMARADALAASLALWLAHLVVGAAGGAWGLLEKRAAR